MFTAEPAPPYSSGVRSCTRASGYHADAIEPDKETHLTIDSRNDRERPTDRRQPKHATAIRSVGPARSIGGRCELRSHNQCPTDGAARSPPSPGPTSRYPSRKLEVCCRDDGSTANRQVIALEYPRVGTYRITLPASESHLIPELVASCRAARSLPGLHTGSSANPGKAQIVHVRMVWMTYRCVRPRERHIRDPDRNAATEKPCRPVPVANEKSAAELRSMPARRMLESLYRATH